MQAWAWLRPDLMDYSHHGFLFDWDGVVIDSHAQHEKSWQLLFTELGRPMPGDFFKRTFGMRNQQIIPEWFDFVSPDDLDTIAQLGDRKEVLYREILAQHGIEPLPGVRELLTELKEACIPAAVASSTPRLNINFIMEMTGLAPFFTAVTTGDDVSRGKPDPEVFLKAAQSIGRDPANCIVIEDAFVGITAGKAAGAKVVAVATTHPLESLHEADTAFPNLDGVSLAKLLDVF